MEQEKEQELQCFRTHPVKVVFWWLLAPAFVVVMGLLTYLDWYVFGNLPERKV